MFYGQHKEDYYLSLLFPIDDGICVEIGAYDGQSLSNTYYFEQKGWRCLCIEPIPLSFEKCSNIRNECVNCCISDIDGDNKEFNVFHIGDNLCAISSLKPDKRLIDSHQDIITNQTIYYLKVRSCNSLFSEINFPKKIHFISIDTENTEFDVLKGLDLCTYDIKLLLIENNYNEPFFENYLKTYGYTKIMRLEVNDFYMKKSSYDYDDSHFDWQFYLDFYCDLKNAGLYTKEHAFHHWIYYGKNENRICHPTLF